MTVESRTVASARSARSPDVGSALIAGCFLLLVGAVALGRAGAPAAMLLALTASLVAWHRSILRWHSVVCVVLAVVLFIPIGRFTLPVNLPIGLEPYRIVVALVLAAWAGSLLVDPAVRLRRSPLDAPILVVVSASLGSVLVNFHRVIPLEGAVLKGVTFFLSFVLVYYFIVCVVVTRSAIETITRFFVGGVAFIAVSAIVEQRTHFNVFDRAATFLPFLQFQGAGETVRAGVVRAIGPAQHPIALGVLFAMAIPIGVALARGSNRRWWIPTALISIGLLASTSRTPILSVVVAGLVLFALRPREMVRLLPLVVPLSLVINFAVPGSIATVKDSFFPKGGLVEQQTAEARYSDPLLAGGRVRQLGPMLTQASRTPVLGQGMGTRQTGFDNPLRNAPILDNQWLGLLLEVGAIGVLGWAWLIVRCIRRLAHASRTRAGPDGWLAAGYAGAIASFSIGMFTYDSLSFVQVAFVFWVILALSSSLLLIADRDPEPAPATKAPVTVGEARRRHLAPI